MLNDKYHRLYKGDTSEEVIRQADKDKVDIISQLFTEMTTDDENETEKLLELYLNVTDEERALLDYMLVSICGNTLHTLIENARATNTYLEEDD